jgi:hypothetical protein
MTIIDYLIAILIMPARQCQSIFAQSHIIHFHLVSHAQPNDVKISIIIDPPVELVAANKHGCNFQWFSTESISHVTSLELIFSTHPSTL